MQIEHSDARDLSPEEQAHLQKLKACVQEAMADGRLSEDELQSIRHLIQADHKVTIEELEVIRSTIQEALGDAFLEYDWG